MKYWIEFLKVNATDWERWNAIPYDSRDETYRAFTAVQPWWANAQWRVVFDDVLSSVDILLWLDRREGVAQEAARQAATVAREAQGYIDQLEAYRVAIEAHRQESLRLLSDINRLLGQCKETK